jgi:hypothetical protein
VIKIKIPENLRPKRIEMYELESMSELEQKVYFASEQEKSNERYKLYDFNELVFIARNIRDNVEGSYAHLDLVLKINKRYYDFMTAMYKDEKFSKNHDLAFTTNKSYDVKELDLSFEENLEKYFPKETIDDILFVADSLCYEIRYQNILRNPSDLQLYSNTRNYFLKNMLSQKDSYAFLDTIEKKESFLNNRVKVFGYEWNDLVSKKGERKEKINEFLRKYRGVKKEKLLKDRLEISKERLDYLLKKIKPVIHQNNDLYYIKNVDPINSSVIYDPKPKVRAENLEKLCSIKTYHPREVPWMSRPSIAEVIAQIPKRYVEQTVAFEILVDTFNEYEDSYRTIIYKKLNTV